MNSVGKQQGQSIRRILSIDGGGILGTFPVAVLAELEQNLEQPIVSYFDLIAGTSTGGILAIGLNMGLSASELLDFYEKRSYEIFGQNNGKFANALCRYLQGLHWIYRSKYRSDVLRNVLKDALGDKIIGDAKTRMIIPAWNSVAQGVYIYKTAHHKKYKTDHKSLALDAALATSAAPTYFASHITQQDASLLDGGIWANNPIAIATVEAIAVLGWPRESLRILSLGCLKEAYSIPKRAGLGNLGPKIITLTMDGQSQGAMGIAKLLTGHKFDRTAIFRIDHTVPFSAYKMDDTSVVQDLKGLGHAIARERLPELEPIFFQELAEKFLPVHELNENTNND